MRNSDSRTGSLISERGPTRPHTQENQCPNTSTPANLDSSGQLYELCCSGFKRGVPSDEYAHVRTQTGRSILITSGSMTRKGKKGGCGG